MMEYLFANDNGENVCLDYSNLRNKINNTNIIEILKGLYDLNGHEVNLDRIDGVSDVYKVSYINEDKTEFLIAKELTPGGRGNLNDEQRIQVNGRSFNFLFQRKQEGFSTLILGLYKYFEKMIISAWNVVDSKSDNPVSKQIKIASITKAIKIGFNQQNQRGRDVFYCSFRPEFFNFYNEHKDFLHVKELNELFSTGDIAIEETLDSDYGIYSRQKIYFGAPGTGKSKKISTEMNELLNSYETNYERVTFHPDYSYAQFVGTYKPVPDDDDRNMITYKYVPGPFIRTLVNAKNKPEERFLLIIEEINRANIAAVFGDVFQLLDRENYISEYPISPSEDLKKYLSENLEESQELTELRIPQNMFIWATMNSADQGVFPMDTAFKRRWEFEYMGINDNEEVICSHTYTLGSSQNERQVNWNVLRKAINNFLIEKNVNEDKLLGPFFISPSVLQEEEKFKDAFKNKVLMYLFDDAAKNKGKDLFAGCDQYKLFSAILSEFDSKGVLIFNESISDQFSKPNISEATTGNSDVVNSNEEEE